MAGVVHIPWYATGLARRQARAPHWRTWPPVALRYGARSYSVFRYRDDRYKFLQTAEFEHKAQFERYWRGPEFTEFRVLVLGLVPGACRLRLDRPRRGRHARARAGRPRHPRRRGRRAGRRPGR